MKTLPTLTYAEPRYVSDLSDCVFYHTVDLPGFGTVDGEWDLRRTAGNYLGHVPLAGKHVLEMGAANGFLTWYMESQGARVTCYDLSPDFDWDVVPFACIDTDGLAQERKEHIRKQNNAFWLTHRLLSLNAKVIHGTVYGIPAGVNEVDITTFGSILLHTRDPLLAIQQAARVTREKIIITEILDNRRQSILHTFTSGWAGRLLSRIRQKVSGPSMILRPNRQAQGPLETWWHISPELLIQYLNVLGFGDVKMTYHEQTYRSNNNKQLMYTLVATRTEKM
ncbi:class I SAM-dependent methyltransferase [Arsenicibacter rosenii]|uniref:Uncharacterized protein n=1 Tax=Arsenicibacter rosenii TaxID=1750698 RepID=A0A1S2VE81_9BACT|nr:class I SAM-dependent methyltransferase [Arsenicibacter rosenii]OIN57012.1 hypothetical protein BLX24_21925 [Arsenicibacter rosenii]